jgi:hypothetical protein
MLAAAGAAEAQSYCGQLRGVAQQNWALYRRQGDPAHQAAAQNYDNAYAAYCRTAPAAPSGGGRANAALAVGNALMGMMGVIAAMAMGEDEEDEDAGVAQDLAPALSEVEMQRLREDAEIELAEVRRRCAVANPFGKGSGCRDEGNPFAREEDSPYWDSTKKRDCAGVVDFGRDGCVPDFVRKLLAEAKEQQEAGVGLPTPGYKTPDYSHLVLSADQYRRLAAGEPWEEVVEAVRWTKLLRQPDAEARRTDAGARRKNAG